MYLKRALLHVCCVLNRGFVKSWLLKSTESDLKTKIFVKTAKFQAGKYIDYIFETSKVFHKMSYINSIYEKMLALLHSNQQLHWILLEKYDKMV